ncbi:MAG: rod-binding protein [Acetobacteraceae bacterium]|nr:rod-binding protein [Acetobacteraceae bacterium]
MNTILPPGKPTQAQLADPATARIWQSAQDFEAMVLGQLVAPMFATVETSKGPFGGGAAEETWRPMLAQEVGKHIARGGGLGLAAPVFRQMLHAQELANAARTPAPEPTP